MKIVTPISDFFKDSRQTKILTELSDILELRDRPTVIPNCSYYFYHSVKSIVSKWNTVDIADLEVLANKYSIKAVSFHLLSCYQNNDILRTSLGEFLIGKGVPYTVEELKMNTKENVDTIQSLFGNEVEILVESVPYSLTDSYDIVTDASFISDIVYDNDIYFLLDIPHVFVTITNKSYNADDYLDALPMRRCKHVHTSGFYSESNIAFDMHRALKKVDWNLLQSILDRETSINIEYITIEYYKNFDMYVKQLKQLRNII